MSDSLQSRIVSALQPGHEAGGQGESYYLRQAADMEQFARTACSIAQHDAFLMAAERYRLLAEGAARQPMAAE
jgi:hypothetical protein